MIRARLARAQVAAAPRSAPHQRRRARRAVRAAAAEFDTDDNDLVLVDEGAEQEQAASATSTAEPERRIDLSNLGAIDDSSSARDIPLPTYFLNCLYLDKAVGVAVDQLLASGERGPVTEYYWWPSKDAWMELKATIDNMPWISSGEMIDLLNDATAIINFWQAVDARPSIAEARTEFPNVLFYGA